MCRNYGGQKKTAKGTYVAYFFPPGPRSGYLEQGAARLNLKVLGDNRGTVKIQKTARNVDALVNFNCGSGGQAEPKPEQPTDVQEAANCYLDPSSILQAQQHLKSLGLYKSTIDGVSGRGTKAAIKKAKKLIGRNASAGDCITAKDITEFRLLAETAVTIEEPKKNTFETYSPEDDTLQTDGSN